MSTYLLAFIVSDFKGVTSPQRKVEIWTRPSAINQGKFLLPLAQELMEFLSKLWSFDIFHVIPRFKLVSVPNFVVGGMENWGLIFLR